MSRRRSAAIVLSMVTIIGWLWALILRDLFHRTTTGERPGQFRGILDADLLDDYGRVFGIAHNSGDDARTAQAAIDNGADAIEIDVVMFLGMLYAAHAGPPRYLGGWFFRGPTLEDAWQIAKQASAITLDLKDDSPDYEDALVAFLQAQEHDPVVLMSRSIDSLIRLGRRLPSLHLYASIPNRDTFDRLSSEHPDWRHLDGVAMQHRRVDEDVVRTLHNAGQRIIVWTVNDLTRVNELVRLGVDAITTDNLAILRLLGGRERVDPLLQRRPRT